MNRYTSVSFAIVLLFAASVVVPRTDDMGVVTRVLLATALATMFFITGNALTVHALSVRHRWFWSGAAVPTFAMTACATAGALDWMFVGISTFITGSFVAFAVVALLLHTGFRDALVRAEAAGAATDTRFVLRVTEPAAWGLLAAGSAIRWAWSAPQSLGRAGAVGIIVLAGVMLWFFEHFERS